MIVLKNAVGLTARLRPKIYRQENLSVTKTTIHRATLWSRHLRLWPFQKFQSRVHSKIFYAFSTQTGQSNFAHRKNIMPFQTQTSNQISYVSVDNEKMKLCMHSPRKPEHILLKFRPASEATLTRRRTQLRSHARTDETKRFPGWTPPPNLRFS